MPDLIAPKLEGVFTNFAQNAPEDLKKTVIEAREYSMNVFDPESLPKVGSQLPDFKLTDVEGKFVTLQDILQKPSTKKGVLITFYRGGWCPFCSIALHSLEEHSKEFDQAGVTLVGISPELPDRILTTTEKNELKFEILSDKGTLYAQKLGIVWKMSNDLVEISKNKFGNDFNKINGNDENLLPFATNILIDSKGIIKNIYSNPDWSKRLETKIAVEWAQAL